MRELGEILQRLENAAWRLGQVRSDPEKQDEAAWWGRELSLLEWVLGQEYITRPIMGRPKEKGEVPVEHFTQSARHALSMAVEEARRLKHNYVGTEHLLLGLLRGDCIAGHLLKRLGVDLDKARSMAEEVLKVPLPPGIDVGAP